MWHFRFLCRWGCDVLGLAPCRLMGRCQRFGETYYLNLWSWSEEANSMFLRNVVIFLLVYTAPKQNIIISDVYVLVIKNVKPWWRHGVDRLAGVRFRTHLLLKSILFKTWYWEASCLMLSNLSDRYKPRHARLAAKTLNNLCEYFPVLFQYSLW